ncbi:VOC family protein [Luteipulveratus mongoliensis]|uniref:Glyoxalase n=1 Tax=Luteipulveratus mongoliensis TaxID=571913 RepID=A0A0K1JFN1_9MICO|nr:VOC family protein [Luteipulveratus mongoliensis]AKU15400.1 glyoxalase [Luteipulveratus mongoliensis]
MHERQPDGYTTVAPWVVTDDTGTWLDFVSAAFDGKEQGRVPMDDGSIGHAEIRVGDTVVLAFDRREGWPVMPSLLRIWVDDADETMRNAVEAGATIVTESLDQAFGQRGGRVRDPFGNIWWVSSQVEEVPFEEAMRRLGEPRYQQAMDVAQKTLDAELTGGAGTSVGIVQAD